ncbi:MAG: LPS export ABC transporter permease LptF [Terriglobia bacterium]|jgi:LPS export ABC transporter permease LptF/LPS export ABC transporter permease LptG
MRILTRYILKEVFSHSLIGLLVFTFVIFIRQLGDLLELVVRHNVPLRDMATLFLLPVPKILMMTIPLAVMVGTLIGLSRMAADGEVIAARASGIGIGAFVRPVMLLAVSGWAVTLWMELSLAPQAARKMSRMEAGLEASQVPYEIQPRVFIERFPDRLLYLEDVTGSRACLRGVFLADMTQRNAVRVTLAERGVLVNEAARNRFVLHLEDGTTHEYDPARADEYSIASFTGTDISLDINQRGTGAPPSAPQYLNLTQLWQHVHEPSERQAALVELHYRFALPVAAIVLALVGIPLGISTRKGGKSLGVMLSLLLFFVYYILMAFGLSFAKQGRVSPIVGLWLANTLFALAGIIMLSNLGRVWTRMMFLQDGFEDITKRWQEWRARRGISKLPLALPAPAKVGGRFLQILDIYVLNGWIFYFGLLLVAFSGVYLIFDFFQVLGDIVRNQVPVRVVVNYYSYLLPQVIYLMLPLSILVATLVNFGLLTKTNQVVAIKSAGISLYRLSIPVLAVAALLSGGMFLFADRVLPETNQRQNSFRNQIKGKPAQTFFRPDHQWIFGTSSRIYNYTFFDSDQNVFANLSVFEFDPVTFRMTRRLQAARAVWEASVHSWILENGWSRDINGDRDSNYTRFSVATFKELTEEPSYFKKEVKPSEQMSVFELRRYIADLRQSGFDVVRLSVQFYRKFSYPLIAFVVALIGIPFSFTMGAKGALTGIALSIGIAIVYWSTSSLFEAMGNLSQLPPAMAAWSPDILFGLAGAYLLLRIKT